MRPMLVVEELGARLLDPTAEDFLARVHALRAWAASRPAWTSASQRTRPVPSRPRG
jgi:hypothetical protein